MITWLMAGIVSLIIGYIADWNCYEIMTFTALFAIYLKLDSMSRK